MLHLASAGPDTPRLPEHRSGALSQIAMSAAAHAAGAFVLVLVFGPPALPRLDSPRALEDPCVDVSHIVFVATDPRTGAGGGGGGNRGSGPIRRAEAPGADAITLRAAKPPAVVTAATPAPAPDVTLPSIVVEAVPLASGTVAHIGLPSMGVADSTSTGSGSGGGVGTGTGTGIGSGNGPGLGPGSGGGTGGGVYRPGAAVTAPRVILEVRPKYTNSALLRRLQGTVELEAIVTRDGRASQIRVVRSLEHGGLDDEAIAAVAQWRFAPGRAAGEPVDVLVTILLDFTIR